LRMLLKQVEDLLFQKRQSRGLPVRKQVPLNRATGSLC
jgi:hypothetical protein